MKYLIALTIIVVGCNETNTQRAAVDPGPTTCVGGGYTDIWDSPTAQAVMGFGGVTIGYFIAEQDGCIWVQDAIDPSYHYAVGEDGSLRESAALVFSDPACTVVEAEKYDYPLHLAGDIYVFQFEGEVYEYPLGYSFGIPAGTYYIKESGGSCGQFTGDVGTLRVVQPSAFSRTFTGPVTL